tara:strand:- start:339 stop:569 length:231 start_codon:yes stop_codon:yes gene_type:complete
MTQGITVSVTDWNGDRDICLDEYVKSFTDQTRELYHVLNHKADTATDDWLHIQSIEKWVKGKALEKFMALYTQQNG